MKCMRQIVSKPKIDKPVAEDAQQASVGPAHEKLIGIIAASGETVFIGALDPLDKSALLRVPDRQDRHLPGLARLLEMPEEG